MDDKNSLAFVLTWPFLILAVGLALIAAGDVVEGFYFRILSPLLWIFLLIVLIYALSSGRRASAGATASSVSQAEALRRYLVAFSIAALLPLFVRSLMMTFDETLWVVILGLVLGFAFGIWGLFIKNNKVLTYANIIGGLLVIIYAYAWIWKLGEGARIVAAAFGLLVAIIISIMKLRDRLT